jgi:hypothetical protein
MSLIPAGFTTRDKKKGFEKKPERVYGTPALVPLSFTTVRYNSKNLAGGPTVFFKVQPGLIWREKMSFFSLG